MRAAAATTAEEGRKASAAAMREALRGAAADDADVADDELEDDIDWRPRFEGGLLTAKQMKTAEAIRSKEFKMQVCHALFGYLPVAGPFSSERGCVVIGELYGAIGGVFLSSWLLCGLVPPDDDRYSQSMPGVVRRCVAAQPISAVTEGVRSGCRGCKRTRGAFAPRGTTAS